MIEGGNNPGSDAERVIEPWEAEFREQLRPVMAALLGILPALEALSNPKYSAILNQLSLEPAALFIGTTELIERLDSSVVHIVRGSGGPNKKESAEINFLGRFFSGGNATILNHLLRLDAIVRSYAAKYAERNNETPFTEVNIEGMIALNHDGQELAKAVDQFREALGHSLDIHIHRLDFLKPIDDSMKEKIKDGWGTPPCMQLKEANIYNWPGGIKKYDHILADATFWGRDSKKFEDFSAKSNVYFWYA